MNALLILSAWTQSAEAAPALLVGEELSTESLDRKILKQLYTGTRTQLDGTRVDLILPNSGDETHTWFLEHIVGMRLANFERTWTRRVLSGDGVEPRYLSSAEAVRYVTDHPFSMAIIDSDGIEDTGNIILLDSLE
ncbi:MAG: hypothetical protein ACI8RZ_001729 [Myxococcota bacterium]|jgi:hypothetical protein